MCYCRPDKNGAEGILVGGNGANRTKCVTLDQCVVEVERWLLICRHKSFITVVFQNVKQNTI